MDDSTRALLKPTIDGCDATFLVLLFTTFRLVRRPLQFPLSVFSPLDFV